MEGKLRTVTVLALISTLVALTGLVARNGSGDSAVSAPEPFVPVVHQVSRAVVQIQTAKGLGSGVVLARRGGVVANAYVGGGARRFIVTLAGGDRHPATLVGTDSSHDLAVVRI